MRHRYDALDSYVGGLERPFGAAELARDFLTAAAHIGEFYFEFPHMPLHTLDLLTCLFSFFLCCLMQLRGERLHVCIVGARIVEKPRILLRKGCVLTRKVINELRGEFVLHLAGFFNLLDLIAQKGEVGAKFTAEGFRLVYIYGALHELALALSFFVLVELEAERILHHFSPLAR